MTDRIIVLKFGSSVLRTRADLHGAVHEIYRWYRSGWRVVAVVSAIGATTETLLSEARELASRSLPEATAELLATGERHSAALLGIALDRVGVPSAVIDPREIGLLATGSALDSEPIAVDRARAAALLDASPVIVVPGFFAYSEAGKLRLLGRGGSDLSAVYLAHALNARCRLIKDVDGVYESDPAQSGLEPLRRFVSLGYADALLRARQLIQPKAVHFIEQHSASVEVASSGSGYESTIGPLGSSLVAATNRRPASVLILGLGTVGLGVYQRIAAAPALFDVAGVLIRDRAKHSADGVPAHLLHESMDELAGLRPDIIVDALPGLQPSLSLVRYYLAHGVAVVTANKALIAEAGPDLARIASQGNTSILDSSAAGGSAPMIETLSREAAGSRIQSIAGVLNGTCNFVLDRCMDGMEFDAAVRAAQESGFAEADPAEDLSGRDAGRKLQILSRVAFGRSLDSLRIESLDTTAVHSARTSLRDGETLRVVARAWRHEGPGSVDICSKAGTRQPAKVTLLHRDVRMPRAQDALERPFAGGNETGVRHVKLTRGASATFSNELLSGEVRLEAVAGEDGFGGIREEWNRLSISLASGQTIAVTGRGAGRWPTTEAVMADLFELSRR